MGRHDEAGGLIEQLAPDAFAALPRAFGFTYMLSFLAEACAQIEHARWAGTLYDLLAPFAGGTVMVVTGVVCRGAVSHYLGLLAAAACRWEHAVRHFDEALALHERMRSAPLLAGTRCAYAEALAVWHRASPDAGRLEKARALATAARATAETLRLTALVQRSSRVLESLATPAAPLPATPLPAVGLSAREVEVLRLLARGATNKEIGAALYLSADTVRQHTINLYRKLDVRGRAEATAWAVRHHLFDGEGSPS
jgi:DNA-binding CsgD family transcriptional regulator